MGEKIFPVRIKELINSKQVIPDHQFGFRDKHGTIEQVHKLTNQIIYVLEDKKHCTSIYS